MPEPGVGTFCIIIMHDTVDTVQVGTFWDVPNVLLRASGAQLGLDIVAQKTTKNS